MPHVLSHGAFFLSCAICCRGVLRQPAATLTPGSLFDTLIRQSGIVLPLTRTSEGWYAAPVEVDGQNMSFAVDTGSEYFWSRSAPKQSNASSSTAKFLENAMVQHFSVQYGRGKVSGVYQQSTIQLGADAPHDCTTGHATVRTGIWEKQKTIDGVWGMSCNNAPAAGLLDCLQDEKRLRQRIFALELGPETGQLTLGFVPTEFRSSLVQMPPMVYCGKWQVPLGSMSVQMWNDQPPVGFNLGGKDGDRVNAILDTGTQGLVGPTFAVIELARGLGAEPGKAKGGYGGQIDFYTVPCGARGTLQHLILQIGEGKTNATSVNVTLTGSDLVGSNGINADGTGKCTLHLAGWETDVWILGSIFLRKLRAVVYDVDKSMVSIVP
eukprot:gnl/MRDRNA2_/MRDRNA2_108063_c0_seq1.p1 gnl/MRDRNA2_/MRDRNA2_108063_c0~~gnl/MRDRNA2_/MRDRNA2_108063_c0_seq1.p1  ORF type:complete len:380 (-),score=47.59 gnl/MRDRNA2_/MRDRNA2_108063_c0_seq1:9-1148(-)